MTGTTHAAHRVAHDVFEAMAETAFNDGATVVIDTAPGRRWLVVDGRRVAWVEDKPTDDPAHKGRWIA